VPLPFAIVGRSTEPVTNEIDADWVNGFATSVGDRADNDTAHPLFAVCVEWPAVTAAARLDDGALLPDERRRGIHATHDLTIHRLLRAGDIVSTIATVEALEPHKRGTMERLRIETRDATGALVATTVMGSLFLDVGIEGGTVAPAAPADSERLTHAAAVSRSRVAVAADQAQRYSEGSRIWNPIHTEAAAATAAGLPAPILHGTCTLALAMSALFASAGIDASTLRRVQARFGGMVLMPSVLELRVSRPAEHALSFEAFDAQGVAVIRDGLLTT
jgi:acyl dehydratase